MEPRYYTRSEFLRITGISLLSVPTIISAFGCAGKSGNKAIRKGMDCVLTPESIEGPYYLQSGLVRPDIRENKLGYLFEITLRIVDATTCKAIPNALVDIWHCDGIGFYSGYPDVNPNGGMDGHLLPREGFPPPTNGQRQMPPHDHRDSMRYDRPPREGGMHEEPTAPEETFLRGVQVTDHEGLVKFISIYPGWYAGRAIHIHCKIFLKEQLAVTTQLYLPQAINNEVHADNDPYQKRFPIPLSNEDDMIYRNGGQSTTLRAQKTESKVIAELTIGIQQA